MSKPHYHLTVTIFILSKNEEAPSSCSCLVLCTSHLDHKDKEEYARIGVIFCWFLLIFFIMLCENKHASFTIIDVNDILIVNITSARDTIMIRLRFLDKSLGSKDML